MSNARQAIRAARDAGAEQTAPQKLNEAEALLNRAEDSLERRAYREARRNAIAARDKAAEALGAAQPGSKRAEFPLSAIIARRCFVSGRVQGVFYRASTRQRALELRCRGYARNLPDGRVEVLAVGEPAAVHALIEWLWRGPPAAHVTDVAVSDVDPDSLAELPSTFSAIR